MIFDLAMARHRLTGTRLWILIPIVPTAVTDKNATELFDLAYQVFAFHAI